MNRWYHPVVAAPSVDFDLGESETTHLSVWTAKAGLAMSQKNSGAEACGAPTKSGDRCQITVEDGGKCHHHRGSENQDTAEGSQTTEGGSAPSEQAFEELGKFIVDEMSLKGAEGDSSKTTAAKQFIKSTEGDNREQYRTMFGDCQGQNCSNGANGFEKDYCRSCEAEQDSKKDTEGGDTEGEITVTINGNEVTGPKDEVLELLR